MLLKSIFYSLFLCVLVEAFSFGVVRSTNWKLVVYKQPKWQSPSSQLFEKASKIYHKVYGWDTPPRGAIEKRNDAEVGCFGDSFTFGAEVEPGETWVSQLEKELGKSTSNFGGKAFGVDQAFLKLQDHINKLNSKIIILSFISENINRNVNVYRPI